MTKLHIIQPMGGGGTRFAKQGFVLPKPLIDLGGKPFFYWSTVSLFDNINDNDLTFVVLRDHIVRFNIETIIHGYYPNAKIIVIPEILNGAVLTALKGVENINDNNPIIINDCDHAFRCREFEEFVNDGCDKSVDGALLTFESNDPKYSFLKMDESGNVIQTIEKEAVSTHAIRGAYYFKNVGVFTKYANQYLNNCSYAEFFMSGVYNEMANDGLKIKNFTCDYHIPFGTPDEYEIAKTQGIF